MATGNRAGFFPDVHLAQNPAARARLARERTRCRPQPPGQWRADQVPRNGGYQAPAGTGARSAGREHRPSAHHPADARAGPRCRSSRAGDLRQHRQHTASTPGPGMVRSATETLGHRPARHRDFVSAWHHLAGPDGTQQGGMTMTRSRFRAALRAAGGGLATAYAPVSDFAGVIHSYYTGAGAHVLADGEVRPWCRHLGNESRQPLAWCSAGSAPPVRASSGRGHRQDHCSPQRHQRG